MKSQNSDTEHEYKLVSVCLGVGVLDCVKCGKRITDEFFLSEMAKDECPKRTGEPENEVA
jgi:hypothetical protein